MPYAIKRKKKLDYSHKKYQNNPLFRRKKKGIGLSFKFKLIFAAVVLMIGALCWGFFYSEYFKIKNVEISSQGKLNNDELRTRIFEHLNRRNSLIFSNANIVLLNTRGLADELSQDYNFGSLKISKNFPGTLSIEYEEKKAAYVYVEQERYFFIDRQGGIVNETLAQDPEIAKYIRIDNQGDPKYNSGQIDPGNGMLDLIQRINDSINNELKGEVIIEKFLIDNNENDVKVKIKDGPAVLYSKMNGIGQQTSKLVTLVREKLKDDFRKKQYIDIRFGDMIYYQ